MRVALLSIAAASVLSLIGVTAEALPIQPVGAASTSPEVTLISGGCGPYGHRGYYGHCRPGGGFYGRPFYHGPFYGPHRFYGYRRHFYY